MCFDQEVGLVEVETTFVSPLRCAETRSIKEAVTYFHRNTPINGISISVMNFRTAVKEY